MEVSITNLNHDPAGWNFRVENDNEKIDEQTTVELSLLTGEAIERNNTV